MRRVSPRIFESIVKVSPITRGDTLGGDALATAPAGAPSAGRSHAKTIAGKTVRGLSTPIPP